MSETGSEADPDGSRDLPPAEPDAGSARPLRLALVGPSHPHKGGIAAHTTMLAHKLAAAGHEVTVLSWSHLYPRLLYPGEQVVPGGTPDVPPFPRTVRMLSWARPDSWARAGWSVQDADAVIVVHVIPQVVPAQLMLLAAAGAGRTRSDRAGRTRSDRAGRTRSDRAGRTRSDGAGRTRSDGSRGPIPVAVAHNVLPHEARPGDRALMRALLRRVAAVVVHSSEQARLAGTLGARVVRQLDLPAHLPGGPPVPRVPGPDGTRLLALGIVRDYKGVDLLLEALREVPGPTLTIAGELWGAAGQQVRDLAAQPDLAGRVEILDGYVPADQIAPLLARHDVLTLTYRHATASQNVLLAARHALPVLATDVGTFPGQIRDGVDGLLVPAQDHTALVAALRRLADPAYAARLASGVRAPDLEGPWAHYVQALVALSRGSG